jgi:hypothetical protein
MKEAFGSLAAAADPWSFRRAVKITFQPRSAFHQSLTYPTQFAISPALPETHTTVSPWRVPA